MGARDGYVAYVGTWVGGWGEHWMRWLPRGSSRKGLKKDRGGSLCTVSCWFGSTSPKGYKIKGTRKEHKDRRTDGRTDTENLLTVDMRKMRILNFSLKKPPPQSPLSLVNDPYSGVRNGVTPVLNIKHETKSPVLFS